MAPPALDRAQQRAARRPSPRQREADGHVVGEEQLAPPATKRSMGLAKTPGRGEHLLLVSADGQ
eukprot:13084867-Alexandrium_andersonii.AAC.1